MATRRNALGRGLGALIPGRPEGTAGDPPPAAPSTETPSAARPEPTPDRDAPAAEIPVERIVPNPQQPRREFDEDELTRLASSIRRHGVLQPIVVRRAPSGDGAAGPERYELVVGERRWRASRLAGRETVPAVVADVADRELLEVALVENVQRADLNPIGLGLAFKTMADAGATQEEIGRRVGLDRSSVANHVRLLELPREIQQDVEEGRVTFGHARALLAVQNPERRRHLRRRVVEEGISVRETERLARTVAGSPGGRRGKKAPAPADLEQQRILDLLRDRLKTRVRIVGGPGRGRIEIEYFGPEDLGRIASAILDGR